MTTVHGKTVFITGAGSGIGYQTAVAFSNAGARIVATDIDESGLKQLEQDLSARGGKCRTAILNVTDEAATKTLAGALLSDGWLPDIVVNNAGIAYIVPFVETDMDVWRRTFEVNVVGVAIGSRVFASIWQSRNMSGHIVNIASMASVTPQPSLSAYAASKYAVEGLCEVLAMELEASDIKVTCVHPGVINTPIVQNVNQMRVPKEQFEKIRDHYIQDGITPDVVANAILDGVQKEKTNIFVGPMTGQIAFLRRLLPRTWFRSIVKSAAKRIGYMA